MIQQRMPSDSVRFFVKNIHPVLNRRAKSGMFYTNKSVKKFIHYQSPMDVSFLSNKHALQLRQLYSTVVAKAAPKIADLRPEDEDNTLLANVAKRTLNCQPTPPTLKTNHIPFEVKSKSVSKTAANNEEVKNLKKLVKPYMALTKPNLTFLVTLSAICSYVICPYSVGMSELVFLTAGTALASGAANAINMAREPEFDRKMQRTSTRPVVTGKVSPNQAFTFAAGAGTLGCSMLYLGVNPTVASLGLLNIVLYSWIYTSLKRKSILNTWVGAIVGAIPPLMGWAAASTLSHPGSWVLAGLLYAWQFPHFNSLSHNIRDEYKRAGYVMTAFENPKLNARVALRYSLLMFPLCYGLTYFDITDNVFPFDSSILTAWMSYWAFKFWSQQRKNYNGKMPISKEGIKLANIYAKKMFWASVWYLPGVLVLGMLHKKGQWDRFKRRDELVNSPL